MNRGLKVAISPCPNDTFIFGAWITGLIPADSALRIAPDYLDIQLLNEAASERSYDVIKVSASQVSALSSDYQFLEVGAAMGENCGPLLVSYKYHSGSPQAHWSIAIPGVRTTAGLLLKQLFPECNNTSQVLFSKIEEALINGQFDAGVLIHESRFTYASKGLHLIADLGTLWTNRTRLPIPLGVIAIRRNLDPQFKIKIKQHILRSLDYAEKNLNEILPFIKSHAQEMEEEVIRAHINLYVNQFSHNLGPRGKLAINILNRDENEGPLHDLNLYI